MLSLRRMPLGVTLVASTLPLWAASAAAQEPEAAEAPAVAPSEEPAGVEELDPQGAAGDASGEEPPAGEKPLRPLSADRPDVTESPHTVDAGHFQMEMDLFASERDEGESTLSFATANLKIGVASFLDLQLVLTPLVSTSPEVPDGPRGLGYQDPVVRAKVALVGNDGGVFALGVLPWVRIPVPGSSGAVDASGAVDRAWEAGVAIPTGIELPWELSLGLMVEVDWMRNAALDGHHLEGLATVTMGRPLFGPLSIFVEGTVGAGLDDDFTLPVTVNGGLLYEIHENLVIDAGAYVGLTNDAPDLVSFVGITSRI